MRQVKTETTLTCDRCLKIVENLFPVLESDYRYPEFQSSMCSHIFMCELCPECFELLLQFLGAGVLGRNEKIKIAKSYRG